MHNAMSVFLVRKLAENTKFWEKEIQQEGNVEFAEAV
jgi:hypothetical protein